MKRIIPSWLAFVIYAALLSAAYVWATYKTNAPFEVFAWAFTAGAGAYWGKRLLDKKYTKNGGFPERENGVGKEIGD